MKKGYVTVAVATFIAASPLAGHHSPIIFDQEAVVTIQGTVSGYDWTNPHVYILVEAIETTGDVVEWLFETDATPILLRNGWSPESLKLGDMVSVRANPDRIKSRPHALLVTLEKEDGTILSPTAGLPGGSPPVPAASGLAGRWEQRFENFIQFGRQSRKIPVTGEGAAAKAAYDIRTENPMAQCVPYTSPMIIGTPQYLNEITILDDRITIKTEFYNVERTVYMDGRQHPENGERTTQGHSIGWWEDGALVVDTTLFADHRSTFPGSGLPSGPQKHVVERYALSEDGSRILIDFTVEDPEYLAEPFSGTLEWHHAPHLEFLGFDCDREQATRFMFETPSL